MTYLPFGAGTYTLNSSISSTATSVTLTSFTEPVSGTPYTMALIGSDIAYGTIQPRTTSSEFVSFTGITQNADGTATLTGVTRGLTKKTPFTTSSTFKLPHAGQSIFIISDAPQVFNEYMVLENDETVTGRKVFPAGGNASAALAGAIYSAPTQDTELATKKYIDDIAISGSPDATTSVKGIVELPTQAEMEAGTATGGTGASLVLTNAEYSARKVIGYATDGGSVNTYTVTLAPVPTAYATGQYVAFIASSTNTGNSTLNVNGLGAKSLRLGGTGLFASAIATNMMVGAIYNGTQFDTKIFGGEATAATAQRLALRNSTGDVTVNTTPTASTDAASKAYVDIVKSVSSAIQSTSSSTTQNIDTTINTTFLAKAITIYYNLKGVDSSAATLRTKGVMTYDGTTIRSVLNMQFQTADATALVGTTVTYNATAPNSGGFSGAGNTVDVTLTVITVTATTIVVRSAYRINGSGATGTADFTVVATA